MQGFLEEDILRRKAAPIGETVSRNREQVVIPAIKFTCAGSISEWRFVAELNTGNGRNRYPEIQICMETAAKLTTCLRDRSLCDGVASGNRPRARIHPHLLQPHIIPDWRHARALSPAGQHVRLQVTLCSSRWACELPHGETRQFQHTI